MDSSHTGRRRAKRSCCRAWTSWCHGLNSAQSLSRAIPMQGMGGPPIGLERMLRMYLIANWFNLADEACKDALYYVVEVFRDFHTLHLRSASRIQLPANLVWSKITVAESLFHLCHRPVLSFPKFPEYFLLTPFINQ